MSSKSSSRFAVAPRVGDAKSCSKPIPFPQNPEALWQETCRAAAEDFARIRASDPILAAMFAGVADTWGALFDHTRDRVPYVPPPVIESRYSEASLWRQPFADRLELLPGDGYDTSALTEEEYVAFMSWLYAGGWDVGRETRTLVFAVEDTLPHRLWVPPGRFDCLGEAVEEAKPKAKPISLIKVQKAKPAVVIPRFCRDSSGGVLCADPACRYVHADTIPRINMPCSFGEACGASDPTGVKRAACIRMHPGETWDDSMVIHRVIHRPAA